MKTKNSNYITDKNTDLNFSGDTCTFFKLIAHNVFGANAEIAISGQFCGKMQLLL